MKIEGLDEAAEVLPFTPLEKNAMGEWDTPREFQSGVTLSFLFPGGYFNGEVLLQEGYSLAMAIRVTKSCQKYDGGGVVIAVIRQREGGRKVKESPWGKPTSPRGNAVKVPETETENVKA